MSKVIIQDIEVKNPKDSFLANIDVKISLDVSEPLSEGFLTRAQLYGNLRWLC